MKNSSQCAKLACVSQPVAMSLRGVIMNPTRKTYLIPKQLRGPLENATRYASSDSDFSESDSNQRSGLNRSGSGKMSGLVWTIKWLMPTIVCQRSQNMRHQSCKHWNTTYALRNIFA